MRGGKRSGCQPARSRRNSVTNPNILYVRALDCIKSERNVRTQSDESADAELEANIGETGIILQNLIGVPVPRKKGQYEIFGGGRRLESVHRNIASGKLSDDFLVPVLVMKGARDAIETSLAENYYHLRMNAADECRAFRTIIDREKKTPAQLAKRLGVSEKFVLGRLRLANLAEPVFEALRTGEITLEIAKAYGSTADTDRQTRVFEQLAHSYHRHNANEIRRSLATDAFRGADPKAMLVGRDAYVAAGGRFESDLFSDHASELWLDAELVERLAEETLVAAAAAIRVREGFGEVRPLVATSVPYSETFQLRQIEPEPSELSPELEDRCSEIENEIAEIGRVAHEADSYTEEQEARVEALKEELGALTSPNRLLTDAQKSTAIAYVLIDHEGKPQLYNEYYALEPDDADQVDGDDDDDIAEENVDSDDGEDGDQSDERYSQKLRDELAMMKTELLAVHVASDPQFALDLGIFIMVDDACRRGWNGMPSELRAKAPTPRVSGYVSDTAAAEAWLKLDDALDRSWLDHKEMQDRYDAFCELDEEIRAAWLGWVIARTLHAVPEGQTGSAFLNHLGAKLEIDVAAWWRPTAKNFFDRLTKPRILDLFDGIGGLELRNRYSASRKFDLSVSAEKLFAGQVVADADVKERALAWLPSAMRFASDVVEASVPSVEAGDAVDDAAAPGIDPAVPDATAEVLPQAA